MVEPIASSATSLSLLRAGLGVAKYWYSSRSLVRSLRKEARSWSLALSEDLWNDPVSVFLLGDGSIQGSGPACTRLRADLEALRVPPVRHWLEALLERWRECRGNIPRDRNPPSENEALDFVHFLQIAEEEAEIHLHELATRLSEAVRRDHVHATRGILDRVDVLAASPSAVTQAIDTVCDWLREGTPTISLDGLRRIKERDWGRASGQERFRILANIGHSLLALGRREEAAASYLACPEHKPGTEEALALEALAYLLVDDAGQAYFKASQLLDRYPNCARGHMIKIRAAPGLENGEAVETTVPRPLLIDPEVALALAERSSQAGYREKAIEILERARAIPEPWKGLTFRLAALLLEKANDPAELKSRRALIQRAVDLLSELLAKDSPEASHRFNADATSMRGEAHRMLGEFDLAIEDYRRVSILLPGDENAQVSLARSLLEGGVSESEAIHVLEKCTVASEAGPRDQLLAALLFERDRDNDIQRALELLERGLPEISSRPVGERGEYLALLLEIYLQKDAVASARHLADTFAPGLCDSVTVNTLQARTRLHEGLRSEAEAVARRALAAAQDTAISLGQARRLAILAGNLGLAREAFNVLEPRVSIESDMRDVGLLLHLARASGRDDFVLELSAKLSEAGRHSKETISTSIEVLYRYSEFDLALRTLDRYVGQNPEDHIGRLNLAVLSREMGREVAATELASLATTEGILFLPKHGPVVVGLLIAMDERHWALEYAYQLWRRFPLDAGVNRALIGSLLAPAKTRFEIAPSSVVDTRSAVLIEVEGTGERHWLVPEVEPSAAAGSNEHHPSHPWFQALLNKSVGARVELPGGSLVKRMAKVVEIRDKRLYRAQQVMEIYEKAFPDQTFFEAIPIAGAEADVADFTSLVDVLRKIGSGEELLLEHYRNGRVPIATMAAVKRKSVFEMVEAFACDRGASIRASSGTHIEFEQASKALETYSEIVLDQSAIATMALAGASDLLLALPFRFVVMKSALGQLRALAASCAHPNLTGFMGFRDGRPFVEEISEDFKVARRGSLETLVAKLENSCDSVGGSDLAYAPTEFRNEFREVFPSPTLEAFATASRRRALVVIDDWPTTELLRTVVEVPTASTHHLVLHGLKLGLVSQAEACRISAELIRYGFKFTAINPQMILTACESADWRAGELNLGALLGEFSSADWSRPQAVRMLSAVLSLIWRNAPSEFNAGAVSGRLLSHLSARSDAREVAQRALELPFPELGVLPAREQRLRGVLREFAESGAIATLLAMGGLS